MKRILLVVALLFSTSIAYGQYTFKSLEFPDGTLTTARGINNQGEIVGAYRVSPPPHALLIKNNSFLPLAPTTLLGTASSEAIKNNDRGDVVGSLVTEDGLTHGFLLSGGVVTILDFPGANFTRAFGINQSRTVVGEWAVLDDYGTIIAYGGFLWKAGVFTDAKFFPGEGVGSVAGINEKGDLVGTWSTSLESTESHGFVYSAGRFVSFDVPFPDSSQTQPNDINEYGYVVGLYFDVHGVGRGVNHAFLKVGEQFVRMDKPDAVGTTAWGINARGEIVGTYYDATSGPPKGYIAKPPRY